MMKTWIIVIHLITPAGTPESGVYLDEYKSEAACNDALPGVLRSAQSFTSSGRFSAMSLHCEIKGMLIEQDS